MWVAVFRAGTWTDSAGRTRTWTEQDLERIAASYDPSRHEAPVVVGHPRDNAPAYGWVEALERRGDMLWAKLKDLTSEFVEWLQKRLYKKRSISLYPDGSLRHVGFLGAAPPAVKGLPDPAFREDSRDHVQIDMEEVVAVKLHERGFREAMRRIRAGEVELEASWSLSAAEENAMLGDPPDWETYGSWHLGVDPEASEDTKAHWKYPYGKRGKVYRSALTAIRQRAGQHGAEAIFEAAGKLLQAIDKEADMHEELERLRQAVEAERAAREEAERRSAEASRALRRLEIQSFCDALVRDNKIPPAFLDMGLTDFLAALDDATEMAFAEEKMSPAAWFRRFLEKLPEVVPLGAHFTEGKAQDPGDAERALGMKIARVGHTMVRRDTEEGSDG